jgi:signal transduction histidine kinase
VDPQISSSDEIGELAHDFRSMARDLREGQLRLLQSEKMAAFGQLGAGITHEIKNPLGAIRGFAQLGRHNLENKEQVQEALEIIENETDRCLDIVQNFLRFARSDRGRHTRVDLNSLVTEGLKIVAHQLSTSGFRLYRQLGDDGEVMASAGQIQQVLLNLLLNAEQASNRGGNIWVSTATLPDGWLEIAIRDDGPGIPPELQARVFEPFFTTKAEDKGTGLGLSVSYGIIKDHGGELSVESEVGKGATFRIRLPAAPPETEDG